MDRLDSIWRMTRAPSVDFGTEFPRALPLRPSSVSELAGERTVTASKHEEDPPTQQH